MNIDHVEKTELPQQPLFVAIFQRQRELAERYHEIERRNGFYYPPDMRPHIDDAQFQSWIKGMFWRTHEEVAEALETIPDLEGKWQTRWDTDSDLRHFFEELSDALHFLAEVSLVVGLQVELVQEMWEKEKTNEVWVRVTSEESFQEDELIHYAAKFVFAMGLAANALKNKPWKTTQMATDEGRFQTLLFDAWRQFIILWLSLGCKEDEVWNLYHRKNMVNQFRQSTRY